MLIKLGATIRDYPQNSRTINGKFAREGGTECISWMRKTFGDGAGETVYCVNVRIHGGKPSEGGELIRDL